MPFRKSEICSRLWESCDALRGGMDASQYKDYMLAMLFLKYVSGKARRTRYPCIIVPEGAAFDDAIALRGKADNCGQLNKKIFWPIAEKNMLPQFARFNNDAKLGKAEEKRDALKRSSQ